MQSWEFGVLGPLQARCEGTTIPITAPKQRVLLAALAIAGHEAVSVDRLLALLWGERPPASAHNTVKNYALRLRRTLTGDSETSPILTTANGYRLGTPVQAVDLFRFVDLEKRARAEAASGALDSAAELLEQALRLWRGAPLEDVPSDLLHQEVSAGLVERRLVVVELGFEVALRRGRHDDVVTDLAALSKQHPLRERVSALAMLALYRCGRASAALDVYHETTTALRDELGVDPGPALQTLHQQILRQEPTLHAGDSTLAVSRPAPRQLPADTVHFTGREDQLTRLLALCPTNLDNGAAPGTVVVSAVAGMAGVGKTALAVHAAHRLADRFADGVLFVDLRGFTPGADPVTSEQALDYLLRGLGVSGNQIPPDLDARAALYRTVLAQRRVLIVLDNAADETQLQPLLPSAPGCWVVVTSRRHLAGLDDAVHLSLPVLPTAEATALFHTLVTDRATAEDTHVVEEIVARCGHLPLAIRIAAARLRSNRASTPARLLAELSEVAGTGQGLDWLSDGHRAVATALEVSYLHLTADQRHAFRLLGLHPGADIEPYALAALADTTLDHARQLLDQLHAASLVDQTGYRRYALHDLVAAYAGTLARQDPELDWHATLGRLFGHYAHTTSVAIRLAYPWEAAHPWEADHRPRPPATGTPTPSLSDGGQAQRWLDAELDNLLAAAHHAPDHGWPDHVSHQATALHRHLRTRGRITDNEVLLTLALTHTRKTGDRGGEHNALLGLAGVYLWQGRYDEAVDCCERSLPIARETGNRTGEQLALHCRGDVHKMRNQFAPASDHLERALAIARDIGNRTAEQDILHCLGGIHRSLGRYEQAIDCCRRSLAIARDTGNRVGEQIALHNRGDIHWLQGQYSAAADLYRQVLAIARDTGNAIREQFALCGLGNTHLGLGRPEPAADCYRQALTIAHQTRDRVCQFQAHQGLGRVNHATGHHHEALDHHRTALGLATELGQPADQARAHDGLAHAHHALGDTALGRRHWHAALDILTELDLDRVDEPGVTTATIRAHCSHSVSR